MELKIIMVVQQGFCVTGIKLQKQPTPPNVSNQPDWSSYAEEIQLGLLFLYNSI